LQVKIPQSKTLDLPGRGHRPIIDLQQAISGQHMNQRQEKLFILLDDTELVRQLDYLITLACRRHTARGLEDLQQTPDGERRNLALGIDRFPTGNLRITAFKGPYGGNYRIKKACCRVSRLAN